MSVSVEALSVALRHPVISADQCNICTLLKINKAWSAAVQQSASGLMDAVLKIALDETNCCREFADWLPKHASLLRTITLIPEEPWEDESYGSFNFSMQPAIELSIQLAAMTAAAVGPPQSFALHEFVSRVPLSARTLGHLSATHLTKLVLNYSVSEVRERAGLGCVIQHFSNLHSLQLDIGGTMQCSRYIPAISNLSQLTSLRLSGVVLDQGSTGGLEDLPTQLQDMSLQLHYDDAFVPQVSGIVNLSQMTGLRSFMLLPSVDMPEACMLPTQLTSMHIDLSKHVLQAGPLSACRQYNLAALQQLQRLVLRDSTDSPGQLLTLTALRQLQELQLSYAVSDSTGWMYEIMCKAAPVWRRLPSLCNLATTWEGEGTVTPHFLEHMLHEIGAVSSLTTLTIEVPFLRVVSDPDEPPLEGQQFVWFQRLRNLQCLKQLSCHLRDLSDIEPGSSMPNDALHLTALMQLTRLALSWGDNGEGPLSHGLDSTLMSAIALQMPQLQWLDLSQVGTSLDGAIPSFGMLRKLQHLSVPHLDSKENVHRCLDYLTHLTNLTHLGGFCNADRARIDDFWSVIQGQHGLS